MSNNTAKSIDSSNKKEGRKELKVVETDVTWPNIFVYGASLVLKIRDEEERATASNVKLVSPESEVAVVDKERINSDYQSSRVKGEIRGSQKKGEKESAEAKATKKRTTTSKTNSGKEKSEEK